MFIVNFRRKSFESTALHKKRNLHKWSYNYELHISNILKCQINLVEYYLKGFIQIKHLSILKLHWKLKHFKLSMLKTFFLFYLHTVSNYMFFFSGNVIKHLLGNVGSVYQSVLFSKIYFKSFFLLPGTIL